MARTAASNVNRVKIKKVCAVCHRLTAAVLQTSNSVVPVAHLWMGRTPPLPGQWPPLWVPPQVLAIYEHHGDACVKAAGPAAAHAPPPPDNPIDGTVPSSSTAPQTTTTTLSTAQLKAEILKLERSLNDPLQTEGSVLRTATLKTILDLRAEMAGRKSSGQQLDQALAKEKTARRQERVRPMMSRVSRSPWRRPGVPTNKPRKRKSKPLPKRPGSAPNLQKAMLLGLVRKPLPSLSRFLRQADILPTKVNGLLHP